MTLLGWPISIAYLQEAWNHLAGPKQRLDASYKCLYKHLHLFMIIYSFRTWVQKTHQITTKAPLHCKLCRCRPFKISGTWRLKKPLPTSLEQLQSLMWSQRMASQQESWKDDWLFSAIQCTSIPRVTQVSPVPEGPELTVMVAWRGLEDIPLYPSDSWQSSELAGPSQVP